MKINGVSYNVTDIKTAARTAIPLSTKEALALDISGGNDHFIVKGLNSILLFKTEGRYKIVAMPAEEQENPSYSLINKHALKKTHTEFVDARQVTPLQQLQNRFNARPNNSRRHGHDDFQRSSENY